MKNIKYEKIEAFAKERGYEVSFGDEIYVTPIDRKKFPEVYRKIKKGKCENEYSIQTFSCGALNLREFKDYLNAHMQAAELVSFLNETLFGGEK